MNWLRLLVAWYVCRCNENEGPKRATLLLSPKKYRLCGKAWENKNIQITIDVVPNVEPIEDCGTLWVITPNRLFR